MHRLLFVLKGPERRPAGQMRCLRASHATLAASARADDLNPIIAI
jgi:hypothetical protein